MHASNLEALMVSLGNIRDLSEGSRLKRFFAHPVRYIRAITHRLFFYRWTKKEWAVISPTFYGHSMHLLLPSSTDIYLTGGKSNPSEIRLARFMIQNIKTDDNFLDVGAHYGYFSLLAAYLTGQSGRVVSFEAAPVTYSVLERNAAGIKQMSCFNCIVADTESVHKFYIFPNLYSEYNTMLPEQFDSAQWIDSNKPEEHDIKSVKLDNFFKRQNFYPDIIKIDVEGAEYQVISGMLSYLKSSDVIVAMEFLSADRHNEGHLKAAHLLFDLGYEAHSILETAALKKIECLEDYFAESEFDSDNIIFRKS